MTEFKPVGGSLEVIRTACLANQIFGQHYSQLMPRVQVDHILDNFNSYNVITERIKNGGYSYYFILNDNRQIGFFAYCPRLGDAVEITQIGLLRKHRGRGNAKRAISFIKEQAAQNGIKTIKIKIDKKNESALAAFEKLGFEEIGEEQERLSGDFFMELKVLALSIDEPGKHNKLS